MPSSPVLVALHRARLTLQPVLKNQEGPEFAWADLASVLECRAVLRRCGLMDVQYPFSYIDKDTRQLVASVRTVIQHVKTGEHIEGTVSCGCAQDRLEFAATITTLRKVGLSCIIGLVQQDKEPRFSADGKNEAQRIVQAKREEAK